MNKHIIFSSITITTLFSAFVAMGVSGLDKTSEIIPISTPAPGQVVEHVATKGVSETISTIQPIIGVQMEALAIAYIILTAAIAFGAYKMYQISKKGLPK